MNIEYKFNESSIKKAIANAANFRYAELCEIVKTEKRALIIEVFCAFSEIVITLIYSLCTYNDNSITFPIYLITATIILVVIFISNAVRIKCKHLRPDFLEFGEVITFSKYVRKYFNDELSYLNQYLYFFSNVDSSNYLDVYITSKYSYKQERFKRSINYVYALNHEVKVKTLNISICVYTNISAPVLIVAADGIRLYLQYDNYNSYIDEINSSIQHINI